MTYKITEQSTNEKKTCHSCYGEATKLISVNDIELYLCENCIEDMKPD